MVKLFNYGWFEDEASDLAIEMAEIYLQNRTRKQANKRTIARFRVLFDKWNSLDD